MKPSILECVTALRNGRPVLCLIDNPSGVRRGFLLLAAENATPAGVNVLAREGRGVICAGIPAGIAKRLGLEPMVPHRFAGQDAVRSVCTVSVDARYGTTTGISAGDRAVTLRLLANPGSTRDDFVQPGHLFPYVVHEQGVLGRAEAAEAAADLARLAGLAPVGAFCGVLDGDGHVAGAAYLDELAARLGVPVVNVADLVRYRLYHDAYIKMEGREPLETRHGRFDMITFDDGLNGERHYALVRAAGDVPAVYAHAACVAGDVFASVACRSGERLQEAMAYASAHGGAVIYVGARVAPGDRRNAAVAHILSHLGYRTIALLRPWEGLEHSLREAGIAVARVVGSPGTDCVHTGAKEAMAVQR